MRRPQKHLHGDIGIGPLRIGAVVEVIGTMTGDQVALGVEGDAQGHFLFARLIR